MAGPRLSRLADAMASLKRQWRGRSGVPNGVLLVSAGGLGDTVLLAHVVRRFMGLAADGEPVTMLLRADAAGMAFVLPPQARVETVDFSRLRKDIRYRLEVMDRLFEANYRLVASTDYLRHPDLDEALIRACRAAEAVAMVPRPWPKYAARLRRNAALYDRLFDSGPAVRDKVLRWWDFADWLTGESVPPAPLRLAAGRLAPAARLAAPTVLIQPFSAVRAKQSPVELYRRVIEALPEGHQVRITGAAADLERNPEFKGLLAPPAVVFDAATFEELVPTLKAARLVITVDTALMHLAASVGAPTLALASAAFVGEIVPYAPEIAPANLHVLYRTMPCEGCLGSCVHPLEDGMYRCVAELDAAAVVARIGALLGAEAGP
ncbi:MAG: glycosyltransferase family 9 protein [Rhodospirillales bacterium]|nr:glycosyltransferase family 9 protein [Rhodospirillales bacterium]MDP6773964.1 glycosyltransferase family 9 protein [Rhodospirillales bacterium]